jgi:hypothetical protein
MWVGVRWCKFMSEPKLENDCGLIISPEELLRIQQACIRRRAELEAASALPPMTIALESPQGAREVLRAPSPIPVLASAFWQGVLFGSPDALLSATDVILAFRLLAEQLQIPMQQSNPFGSMRAGALRKLFRERFGHVEAEQAMVALWRSAPASPGAPLPAPDQSQLPPGRLPAGRSQLRWIAELNEPEGSERQWLMENGLWYG